MVGVGWNPPGSFIKYSGNFLTLNIECKLSERKDIEYLFKGTFKAVFRGSAIYPAWEKFKRFFVV